MKALICALLFIIPLIGHTSSLSELKDCHTKFRLHSVNREISLEISYSFINRNISMATMSGYADLNGNRYSVNREVEFKVEPLGGPYYKFRDLRVIKNPEDSLSDVDINKYWLFGDRDELIKLTFIGKNILFSNTISPVFLCITND